MQANIKESFDLLNTASQFLNLQNETISVCRKVQNEAEKLLDETQREEENSLQMLNVAREVEEAAYAAMQVAEGVMFAAEARLAAAVAEEGMAIASGNPVAIAAATAAVVSAEQAFETARQAYETAKQAYEIAKAHRELLDKRYSMAQQCVNLARAMKAKLSANCVACISKITPLVEQGTGRIHSAYEDLQQYHSESTSVNNLATADIVRRSQNFQNAQNNFVDKKIPAQNYDYENWSNYTPKIGQPVKVEELHDRLNPSNEVIQGMLENLYNTDENFRSQVDSYRAEGLSAETKIKKNMAGRLAEEIVVNALKPYGEIPQTQVKHDLSDGGYTKTDFVLKDLKVPLIFGRGEGSGVREGGDIAIEVKSGSPNYLKSQLEHIKTQAQGHANYNASWVICTRDIKNLEENFQTEYRREITSAGSPPIGMLPYKSEIDAACMKFVFKE